MGGNIMKRMDILGLMLVFVIAFTSFAPAPSSLVVTAVEAASTTPINLTITNPLPKATTVTLDGTRSYTIYLPKGAIITKKLDAGKYKFTYNGCLGKKKTGNLKVKAGVSTLLIAACKTATWVFVNPSSHTQTVTISLRGWMSYNESIAPGQTKVFSWVVDTYEVTLKHCGTTYNETWRVKGKKGWVFRTCP